MDTHLSRRNFLGKTSLGFGAYAVTGTANNTVGIGSPVTIPKYVNVGTVSIDNITASNPQEMIKKVILVMENMLPCRPDIICLPEIFAYAHISGKSYQVKDIAERSPGLVVTPFQEFARQHRCYIICPTYTKTEGNIYISAVLIDRDGKVAGEYHKMRPTEGEMETGVKPGKFAPPVFDTDFGKIGIQICYDIKYDQGWNYLKDNGAKIIFWPSAYAAGQEISSMAWRHQVYIVSSTQKDTSKICDFTGEALAQTGRWQPNWACASLNLEKTFISAWPAVQHFPAMQKKYGSRIKLSTYSEEEWVIIESLDSDLKVADILAEFGLKTIHESLKELAVAHEKARER